MVKETTMRAAIIENGVVANIAEADEDFANAQGWIVSEVAAIGDLWDGVDFAKPPAPPAPVPASVTRRQAREALLNVGLLDDVEMAIAASEDETERRRAEIYWMDSATFERNNAMLAQIAGSIGLSDTDIDELFIAAAAL
jgi:hypothetical protein